MWVSCADKGDFTPLGGTDLIFAVSSTFMMFVECGLCAVFDFCVKALCVLKGGSGSFTGLFVVLAFEMLSYASYIAYSNQPF